MMQFPGASQVLGIFHTAQYIASAVTALHGEGPAAAGWPGEGCRALLADGWPGLPDHIGATPSAGRTAGGQARVDELIGYFAKHTGRLGYSGRLRSGQSIGRGGVESLVRRMGCRLKAPGRGWAADNLDGRIDRRSGNDGVDRPLGKERRLTSRIESYTQIGLRPIPRAWGT